MTAVSCKTMIPKACYRWRSCRNGAYSRIGRIHGLQSCAPIWNFAAFTKWIGMILFLQKSRNRHNMMRSFQLVYFSLSAFAFSYLFYELYWKRRQLPPGPTPWLFVGNLPNFLCYNSIDEMFLSWKQKYGAVMTFWVGPFPLVMVSEPDAMKKYFVRNSDIFSNRWRNYVTDTFMGGVNGVVQIDGDKWREQRRFSLHVLRDFGVGRALMEHTIQLEVTKFIEYLMENSGKELDLCQVTAVCVGNIINNILFGNRFPQGSAEFHHLHSLLDEQSRLVINPIMGAYIAAPWLTTIPLVNTKWKHLLTIREQLWAYLDIQINEHKEKFDADGRPADFTYSYMKEMHRRKIEGDHPGFFE
uniref:Cytochrome P450 n=1 Tax=Ascaris suum TaxID=6253 RepID=F1L4Z7_ASCSU